MTTKYSKFPIIFSQILFYVFTILGAFQFFIPNFQRAADAAISLLIAVFAYIMYVKYIMEYEKCLIKEYVKCKELNCKHDLSKPIFISDSFWFIGNFLISIVVFFGLIYSIYIVFTYRWIAFITFLIQIVVISFCIANDIRMIILIDSEKSVFRVKYFNDHSTTLEVIGKEVSDLVWELKDSKTKKEVRKDLIKQGMDPGEIDNDALF